MARPLKIDPANLLVIALVASRRVSATIAWLHPDQGEKVVAHKHIECDWAALSDRGRRQTIADVVKMACESAGVEAYSAFIAKSDPSIGSLTAVGYADLGQEFDFTAAEREQALLRARHHAIGDDRELVHAVPVHWSIRSRQGEREVADPIGERGIRLTGHVLLVTARRGYRAELEDLLTGCGLHLDGVIAPPLALSHGIAGKLPRRGSSLVIDCGARHTALLIHRKGVLTHLETHGFGGDLVTERLALGLGIPREHAEDLKHEIDVGLHVADGSDLEGQQFLWREVQERSRLIQPGARICSDLLREFFLARAQALREQELIGQQGQIHLVGRSSALGGLPGFLRGIFDMPVVLGTGQRDRDASAELVDLVVSGLVRTASDERRRELRANAHGLRSAASGLWSWLRRPIEGA